MRHMPLTSKFSKLSSAMRTLNTIVILLRSRLIASISTFASTTSATTTLHSTHCSSELLRLSFPFRQSTFTTFYRHLFSSGLLLCPRETSFFRVIVSLFSHQDLFMLIRDNSLLLTVKLFPFLLKDLVTNASMLIVGFIIEASTTVRTLI